MTFGTKIQTYDGTNANHNTSRNTCAVDWANSKLWMGATVTGTDYLARYGIVTGAEEAAATTASISSGVTISAVGWDGQGSVYLSGPNDLTHGSLTQIDGTALTYTSNAAYAPPSFGGVNIVSNGGGTTMADTNIGDIVINLNNTSYTDSGVYLSSIGWPNSNSKSAICPGKDGSNISFLLTSPGDGMHTQIITLRSVDSSGAHTTIGTWIPSDWESGFTEAYIYSMCVDQTDGNPIFPIGGVGGSDSYYMVKVNKTTGAIIWQTQLTAVSGENFGANQFSQSRIRHNRLAFIQHTPTKTIVVMNTATGAIISTQTTGMAGVGVFGQQSYDDTSGAIIGMFSWDGTAGPTGPDPLNGSTAATGWAALYVTEAIVTIRRRHLSESGPVRLIPGPVGPTIGNDILAETGDDLITETSDNLITET